MRWSLITLLLATSAFSILLESSLSLEDRAIGGRALNCKYLGSNAVVDKFDDQTAIPAIPRLNKLLSPVPNGTWINYTQTYYISTLSISNLKPPSPPNNIVVDSEANNAILKPTFNGANAFQLNSFSYICLTATQENILAIPSQCTFTISCNAWGANGPASIRSQTITYNPKALIDPNLTFKSFSFPATFNFLSQCSIKVTQSAPLAGALPPSAGTGITVLAIDNVSNWGQFCIS